MSRISLTLTLTSLAGIVFQPWLSYFELKGRVAARVGVEGGGGAGSEVAVEVGSGVAMAAVCIQICCDPPSLTPHLALSRPIRQADLDTPHSKLSSLAMHIMAWPFIN